MTTTEQLTSTTPLASTLRRLYFGRFSFAVVWALLLAFVSPHVPALLPALVVVYPLVDAASAFIEYRAAGTSPRSRVSALANVVLSVVAAIALGWASSVSATAILIVWGVWAIVSGVTQLLTAVSRRRLGGQWPVILSGGLSFLVGFTFIAQSAGGAASVTGIAGYATLGGIFFLISAIRLGKATRAA